MRRTLTVLNFVCLLFARNDVNKERFSSLPTGLPGPTYFGPLKSARILRFASKWSADDGDTLHPRLSDREEATVQSLVQTLRDGGEL